jgi:hypothetical protein
MTKLIFPREGCHLLQIRKSLKHLHRLKNEPSPAIYNADKVTIKTSKYIPHFQKGYKFFISAGKFSVFYHFI